MFPVIALLVSALPAQTPEEEIQAVVHHYQSLKEIIYTIVRHESNDPKVKDLADRVRWTPNHFEVNPIPFKDSLGNLASKLICDDGKITTISPLMGLSEQPLDNGANSIGSWESRGGLILVWLMGGKTWKLMTQNVPGSKLSFSRGSRKRWHDRDLDEIVLIREFGQIKDSVSLFVDPKIMQLAGVEHPQADFAQWSEFLDPVEKLPDSQ